jgi:subtilisin family serine protease
MYRRSALVFLALAGFVYAGDVRVIVGFKGRVDRAVVAKHGGTAGDAVESIQAMAVDIPAARLAKLRADPSVAYVEEDGIASIFAPGGKKGPPGGGNTTPPPQQRPWGIDRVGGGLTTNTGAGIKVAVIDTGVDADHQDLAANVKGGVDYTGSRKGWEDENGHGTHVSGTIGAVDNSLGVIGVAPGAHLYGVRVLDRRGYGFWSEVAEGITWTGNNGIQIANMSLGGGYSSTVENACAYAAAHGVLLVAAAGNEGDGNPATTETSYPAAFGSVVAVAATDSSDALASFSNSGTFVEVAGPGVSVLSTYKGNGYATGGGTSMASPHASGVAALIWKSLGGTNAATVRTQLQSKVDDRGPAGKDTGYGYGIVDFSN